MTITTDMGFQQTAVVEPGQRFGRLTVLDADRRVQSGKARLRGALVGCDCGAVKEVVLGSLLRGATRSCGCLNAENRRTPKKRKHVLQPGDIFGYLTVLDPESSGRRTRDRYSTVRCACGQELEVTVSNLVSGNTKSCGCQQYPCVWDRSDPEWEWRRYLWLAYRITPEQYREMLERQGGGCGVCGKPPGKRRLHVDHDHACCPVKITKRGTWNRSCGKCVRGLLCFSCNSKVGWLEAFWGPLAAYLGRGMN